MRLNQGAGPAEAECCAHQGRRRKLMGAVGITHLRSGRRDPRPTLQVRAKRTAASGRQFC